MAALARRPVLHLVPEPEPRPDVRGWPIRQRVTGHSPEETQLLIRARSALYGLDFADGTRTPPDLPIHHARDVCRWHRPR